MDVLRVSCPHCPRVLSMQEIDRFVDRTTFQRFKNVLKNLQIQANPDLKWCPNPRCGVVIAASKTAKASSCPKCQVRVCGKCGREAHEGMSCASVFANEVKGWENSFDIQRCRKCKGLVEKVSGCNHMTCPVCRFEWCWLCGGTYSSYHFNSLNPFGCPGLQFRQRDSWSPWRICLWRLFLFFLCVLLGPIALPFFLLLCGPVLAVQFVNKTCYPAHCLSACVLRLLAVLVGVAFDPLFWVGLLFYVIPKGVKMIRRQVDHRRQLNARSDKMIQEKLLKDADDVYTVNNLLN